MSLIGMILFGSVLILPAAALLALRWAGRTGQLAHAERAALLPFDEAEPVGLMTDKTLGVRADAVNQAVSEVTSVNLSLNSKA